MSAKAAEIADQLSTVTAEIAEFVRTLDDAQWRTLVAGEGWTVGVVVHHIAQGAELVRGWLVCAASGQPIEDTVGAIDDANARHAREQSAIGVEEALADLLANAERTASMIRGFDDEQLARSTAFGPAGGTPMTVEALANVAVRHCQGHFASITAALAH
jgi:uncharacterized damage-inducible protein DinB